MHAARKLIILSLVVLPLLSAGQTYDFRSFSVEDGLGQSQVLSIHQDRSGALWIGTNGGGVSRYNGQRFESFTTDDGLVDNVVFSVCEDRRGNTWFGTVGGLSVFDGKAFRSYGRDDGLGSDRIYKVFEDSRGLLWIGTAAGLTTYDGKAFTTFAPGDSLLGSVIVFSIYEDRKGNLWFGTFEGGLYRYDGKDLQRYSKESGLADNRVRSVCEDAGGSLWIGTNLGLQRLTEGILHDAGLRAADGRGLSVNHILSDSRGHVWLSTYEGAFRYDGRGFVKYGAASGMGSDKLWTMLEDREGNIWIGTNGNGIVRYRGERFVNYSQENGLAGNNIYAVYEDSRGDVWVGSYDAGLSRIGTAQDGKEVITNFGENRDMPMDNVIAILEDRDGRMWFGSRRSGLTMYDGKKFIPYDGEELIRGNDVYALLQDRKGDIWLGTIHGIIVLRSGKAEKIPIDEELAASGKQSVYSIYEDMDGALWFGLDAGALRMKGTGMQLYAAKDGFTGGRVRSILQDHDRNIWFATDDGVYVLREGTFRNVRQQDGLGSNKIYLMLFDKRGGLWLGTNKGIDRLDVISFLEKDTVIIRNYSRPDGFFGVECNANAGCIDRKGNIWFGTIRGVTRYDPSQDRLNRAEPVTRITGIRLRFGEDDWAAYTDSVSAATGLPAGLELPYDKNHLTFAFAGISLTAPEKVAYRYMLEGLDEDWVSLSNKTEVTYPYIPPGEYTFKVRASNNDGLWNREPAVFAPLVIRPPFWMTPWFYIACLGAAALAVYSYIKYRERRLRQEKKVLEDTVSQRTREVVAQKEIIEAKNKDITDSINYARRIQEAMLPPPDLVRSAFSDAFVLYRPKDIVSGDFYWFTRKQSKSFLAVVDCTGHGVPGAFMSMIGHNLLNQIIIEKNVEEPEEVLRLLHEGVRSAFRQKGREMDTRDGMDLALCAVDHAADTLHFAGALRPLCLMRNGQAEEVRGDKQPIGGLSDNGAAFTSHRISLRPGDVFYIYSDGYADQFGGQGGKKFMTRRFREALRSVCTYPMAEQLERLSRIFEEWKGTEEQVDDVLLVGVKY